VVRQVFRVGDLNVIRPGDYHRIAEVRPNTWTLFFTGKKIGSWGFLTEQGHVDHERYLCRTI
jgi:hypothetical protein